MNRWYKMDALRNITGPYDLDRIRSFAKRGLNFRVGGEKTAGWLSLEALQTIAPEVVKEDTVAPPAQGDAMDRGINELIGLCKGVISDGFVDSKEVDFLKSWLDHHQAVARTWPANVLSERIERILSDGVADEIERTDLSLLISRLTGVRPGVADAEQLATRLPVDDPAPNVEFAGKTFHLTGNFILGPKSLCEARIQDNGGVCHPEPREDTDYLIIGALGSEEWAYGPFGREIESVMNYRDAGAATVIVSEEHWTFFLPPQSPS